jgi:hypothetical protein
VNSPLVTLFGLCSQTSRQTSDHSSNITYLGIPNPRQPFPFLLLPAELREMVYSHILPSEIKVGVTAWTQFVLKESQLQVHPGKIQPMNFEIMLACRQVSSEATAYMYREAKLIIYHGFDQIFLKDEQVKAVPSRYPLRSQATSARTPGVMYPTTLGSFQNIHINYNLPGLESNEHLPTAWQTFDKELLPMISAISAASITNPWPTKLQVTFWEPSILFAHLEDSSGIYGRFLHGMRELRPKRPGDRIALFAFKKKLLSVATTRSAYLHPFQLDIMERQRSSLGSIEEIVGAVRVKVHVKAARDWRMCAFLAGCNQSQPLACGPAFWDCVWLPRKQQPVDNEALDEIIALGLPELKKTRIGMEVVRMSA